MALSRMLTGSPILMGDNTVPGVKIHKEVKDQLKLIFNTCIEFGLDFYPTYIEFLTYDEISEIASYGGFPVRYPHWRFGMEYEELSRGYEFGQHRISEMVVNTSPCIIYCLDSNPLVDNIDVIAHALGHNHFFKNNIFFSATDTSMMDKMANHASRIRRYMSRWGKEKVTEFIDHCLRIETLIDSNNAWKPKKINKAVIQDQRNYRHVDRWKHEHNYMDDWINSKERLDEEKKRIEKEDLADQLDLFTKPTRDIFGYLKNNAPLKPWQQDIISMLYEESMYFAPQRSTKMLNEGLACLLSNSLVYTDDGILTAQAIVENKLAVNVFDGNKVQKVVNWFTFENKKSYKIKTKKGYEICGSNTHKILLENEEWIQLEDIKIGNKVKIQYGGNIWSKQTKSVRWTPKPITKSDFCIKNKINYSLFKDHYSGKVKKANKRISALIKKYDKTVENFANRKDIAIPKYMDKNFATWLGFLTGDGHISETGRELGFTNGEEYLADMFVKLTKELFNLECKKRWDDSSLNGRWRISTHSKNLEDLLKHLGLPTGVSARIKKIPDIILKSPKGVMSAFLRAYFDADGCVAERSIILSTSSPEMAKQVQIVLLNYGILSSIYAKEKDNYHVYIGGESTKVFYQEIGFNSPTKQKTLCAAVYEHPWFNKQDWVDEIVSIEELPEQTVYDISVENTHRYSAQGFINHNSWVDYKIMCCAGLCAAGQKRHDAGIIEYAKHKMLVLGGKYSQNPYKLGYELLMDIEDRWNKGKFGTEYEECKDMREKRRWNKHLGLGKEKVFDVCKFYNDATVIAEYFTPEFCEKNEWYEYKHMPNGEWKIVSRDFHAIKRKLMQRYMNGGLPDIRLTDPNHLGKGWFFMQHAWDGRPLYDNYARDTITSIWKLWRNVVVLATKDTQAREYVYVCDGPNHEKDVHIMLRHEYEKQFVK